MHKALAIQSASGEHFGFLLFSGDPPSGDCILQLLRRNPAAFDDPAFQYLENYGYRTAGEHRWELHGQTISLALSTGDRATVDLAGEKLVFDTGAEYRIARMKPNKSTEEGP